MLRETEVRRLLRMAEEKTDAANERRDINSFLCYRGMQIALLYVLEEENDGSRAVVEKELHKFKRALGGGLN